MTLADAILSLHPIARPGLDFVVAPSGDPIAGPLGPDEITRWDEGVLGKRDDAAIAAAVAAGPTPAALRTYAAQARYAKETGGITVGGVKVATDETSQSKIMGAYLKATRDGTFATTWKGSDGTFATLNAATLIALGDAVTAHVAACFAAEGQLAAGIAAGTVHTTAEIDAAFAAVTA